MDQQPPATNQRQRGTWTLATGLASKDMVELFAFTTVDMGLATLWWKLHLEHAGNIAGKLIGKMVENYGNWKLVEKWWKTKTVGKLIRPPVQHPHPQLHMRVNSEQLAEITFFPIDQRIKQPFNFLWDLNQANILGFRLSCSCAGRVVQHLAIPKSNRLIHMSVQK